MQEGDRMVCLSYSPSFSLALSLVLFAKLSLVFPIRLFLPVLLGSLPHNYCCPLSLIFCLCVCVFLALLHLLFFLPYFVSLAWSVLPCLSYFTSPLSPFFHLLGCYFLSNTSSTTFWASLPLLSFHFNFFLRPFFSLQTERDANKLVGKIVSSASGPGFKDTLSTSSRFRPRIQASSFH